MAAANSNDNLFDLNDDLNDNNVDIEDAPPINPPQNQNDDVDIEDAPPFYPRQNATNTVADPSSNANQMSLVTQAVTGTIQQSVKSLDLLDKSAAVLSSALVGATYDQKVTLMQEGRLLAQVTTDAIRAATDLYLALGIRVTCDTPINISSLIPPSLQPTRINTQSGYQTDQALPSASKYSLTLKLTSPVDILPHKLLDMLLKGTGCQVVARTSSNDSVTVRLENRSQLNHAVSLLQKASYKGTNLLTFCEIEHTVKSAYAIRSLPFASRRISKWFDTDGKLKYDVAITDLNADNSGWFPDSDVESIDYYKANPPPNNRGETGFIVLKIFISQAAYRHFLRSSHDITNVDCNGTLIKFKEEVNITQCWNCCQFGHYSNRCTNAFQCRFCISNHNERDPCLGKTTPKCIICTSNNMILRQRQDTGDANREINFFKDWQESRTDHFATSASCKAVQAVKATHLTKLKQAAFAGLPLPSFCFP